MSTLEKEEVCAHGMSAQDFTSEHIAVAVLLERFREIGKDAVRDIVSLAEQWMDPKTPPEDRPEIFETIREILFPELVGGISIEHVESKQEIPEKLRARAEHVGSKIKEIRTSRKLNQTDLAKATGLPQPHISRLENGEHSPSFKTLTKIAGALDVEVGDLDPSH